MDVDRIFFSTDCGGCYSHCVEDVIPRQSDYDLLGLPFRNKTPFSTTSLALRLSNEVWKVVYFSLFGTKKTFRLIGFLI